jgi:hypothetical protein
MAIYADLDKGKLQLWPAMQTTGVHVIAQQLACSLFSLLYTPSMRVCCAVLCCAVAQGFGGNWGASGGFGDYGSWGSSTASSSGASRPRPKQQEEEFYGLVSDTQNLDVGRNFRWCVGPSCSASVFSDCLFGGFVPLHTS